MNEYFVFDRLDVSPAPDERRVRYRNDFSTYITRIFHYRDTIMKQRSEFAKTIISEFRFDKARATIMISLRKNKIELNYRIIKIANIEATTYCTDDCTIRYLIKFHVSIIRT